MTSATGGHDINVVAFRYGEGDEVAVIDVPASADDSISQAWQKVFRQRRVLANQIVAVHAEWAPTAADHEFMSGNFPNLDEVSFNFERPESGDWDSALQQAAATREAAMHGGHIQEATRNPTDGSIDPKAVEPVSIPMLRMATSPPPMSAYRTLLPNQLYVLVARVAPTPRGTLALNWVLQNQLVGADITFDALLDEAFVNLAAGLKITGYSSDDGSDTLLEFTGVDAVHLPAATVAIPNFRAQMASALGGDRFLAGITCHDNLHVVRADSDYSTTALREMVFACESHDEDLVPTLLLIEPDGMRIVAQKGEPLG